MLKSKKKPVSYLPENHSYHTATTVVALSLHFHSRHLSKAPCSLDSLADGHARPIREHARSDIHRLQLLEEQLGSVRHVNLRDLGLVLARTALERLLGEVPVMLSVDC